MNRTVVLSDMSHGKVVVVVVCKLCLGEYFNLTKKNIFHKNNIYFCQSRERGNVKET